MARTASISDEGSEVGGARAAAQRGHEGDGEYSVGQWSAKLIPIIQGRRIVQKVSNIQEGTEWPGRYGTDRKASNS